MPTPVRYSAIKPIFLSLVRPDRISSPITSTAAVTIPLPVAAVVSAMVVLPVMPPALARLPQVLKRCSSDGPSDPWCLHRLHSVGSERGRRAQRRHHSSQTAQNMGKNGKRRAFGAFHHPPDVGPICS